MAQRDAGATGLQICQRRLAVTDPLGENADRSTLGQPREDRGEASPRCAAPAQGSSLRR